MRSLGRSTCLVVALALLVGVPSASAGAHRAQQSSGFSCGPHMLTYLAKWLPGNMIGDGVRCVLVTDNPSANRSVPKVVWYGEGAWDNQPHRHLAEVFPQKGTDDLTGGIQDIFGNGELHNETGTVSVHVVQGSWPAPAVLDITSDCGCWTERWTLAQSIPYTPLKRPTVCGYFFAQYAVTYRGRRAGMRCVVRIGGRIVAWFGRGTINGVSYSELGYRSPKGYGAADLCGSAFGVRCQVFPAGSVTVTKVKPKKGQATGAQDRLKVTVKGQSGTWTETWAPS